MTDIINAEDMSEAMRDAKEQEKAYNRCYYSKHRERILLSRRAMRQINAERKAMDRERMREKRALARAVSGDQVCDEKSAVSFAMVTLDSAHVAYVLGEPRFGVPDVAVCLRRTSAAVRHWVVAGVLPSGLGVRHSGRLYFSRSEVALLAAAVFRARGASGCRGSMVSLSREIRSGMSKTEGKHGQEKEKRSGSDDGATVGGQVEV